MAQTSASDALKTYRYLRLAMVACVLLLGVSVGIEIVRAGHGCWRTSISSYYYTPVRGVFVGSLVAVGVCLIAIKGNTTLEDVLLNIAGCLAPVVAFVPIRDPGECASVPFQGTAGPSDAENNVLALLIVGAVSLAVATWLARRDAGGAGLPPAVRIGLGASLGLLLVGALWFGLGRDSFLRLGHYAAAIPLFACMLAVVVTNAHGRACQRADHEGRPVTGRDLVNGYLVIAVLAVASLVVLGLVTWLGHWAHGVFWIEASQIGLFAAFWILQTRELWGPGIRGRAGRRPASAR